jgi:hypothetical protein
MKISQHFWGWFLITLIFIPITLYTNFSVVEQEIVKERQQVEIAFGPVRDEVVMGRSLALYNFCCAGLAQSLNDYYLSDKEGMFNTETKVILESIWGSLFQVIHRLFVYVEWLSVMWPLILFFFVDALVNRKIRNEDLTYQNPVRYHLAMHGIVFALGASVAYLFFPFSFSLIAIPLLVAMFSYSLYVAISHLHRMF